MINIKFSNQASTALVDPILSTDNTLVVEDASVFPMIAADEYFIVCVASSSAGYEIMKVVGVEDNTLTVVRAQEGTSVKDFPSGASVENRLTAGSLYSVIENASETVPHAREDSTSIGQGSEELFGHVKITDSDTSEATSILGIGVSPYAMKSAFDRILGASTETVITSSGKFKATVAGTYRVTVIGGGGNGGYGGHGGIGSSEETMNSIRTHGGGGGGGGGAGQVKTQNVVLTKDQEVNVIIGGSGGQTSFGSYVSSLGGGNGGGGSNAYATDVNWYCSNTNNTHLGYPGGGGGAGATYGSAAAAGANGHTVTGSGENWNPVVNPGAQGGAGGITSDGTYGNGGRGGNGGGASSIGCAWQGTRTYTYGGTAGQAGTQGCIKIRLAVG